MTVEGIKAAAVLENSDGKELESMGLDNSKLYSWEPWELPQTQERLKESYYILQEIFKNTK